MADGEQNGILAVASHALNPGGDTIIVAEGELGEDGVCEEDILQQALDEASETFSSVEYTQNDSDVSLTQNVNNVHAGVMTFVSSENLVSQTDGMLVSEYVTNGTGDVGGTLQACETINITIDQETDKDFVTDPSQDEQIHSVQMDTANHIHSSDGLKNQAESMQTDENTDMTNLENIRNVSGSLSVSLVPVNTASTAPLGSSQNPIRIIQQGNQYTPVQQLTTEQLQQIMQVVQQQHVQKAAEQGGSSILYNSATNTRIVYRVIYPSELHKDTSHKQTQGQQTVLFTPQAKRTYKKRNREEEEKFDGPELSKEEKEARKKQKLKTRSGRVSKPPKHMVKDYKHIHVLDWDEDYDDSDGGYSDFKVSDEEEADEDQDKESSVHPGLSSRKQRNYRCEICGKAYIGQAGLGRHYRMFPSHGKLEPEQEQNPETPNGSNSMISFSEDSRDSTSSLPYTPRPFQRGRGRGRPVYRGRGRAGYHMTPERRRAKLKEIIRECDNDELIEELLPRLAKVITLWEFLLMKVEKGKPCKPHMEDIIQEFDSLHKQIQKMCREYLKPTTDLETDVPSMEKQLQIQNSSLADALGLKVGCYIVKEILDQDTAYHYKFLTTNPLLPVSQANVAPEKRTVEVVQREQLVPLKIPKPIAIPISTNSAGKNVQNIINSSASSTLVTLGLVPASNTYSSKVLPSSVKVVPSSMTTNSSVVSPSPMKVLTSAVKSQANPSKSQTYIIANTSSRTNVLPANSLPNTTVTNPSLPVSSTTSNIRPTFSMSLLNNMVTVASTHALTNSTVNSSLVNHTGSTNSVSLISGKILPNTVQTTVASSQTSGRTTYSLAGTRPTLSSSMLAKSENTTLKSLPYTLKPQSAASMKLEPRQVDIKAEDSTNNGENSVSFSQNGVTFISVSDAAVSQNSPERQGFVIHNMAETISADSSILCSQGIHEQSGEIINGMDMVISPDVNMDQTGSTAAVIQGQLLEEEQHTQFVQYAEGTNTDDDQVESITIPTTNIYQTEDGIILIQNPDGEILQLQDSDGNGVPLETVQALLAMDGETQFITEPMEETNLEQ
ncbi:hypothetical protein CHS0354_042551 [Potamilus streckersoni]|uniref:C2H2-type domain-containing protein n=1 Tax=Potamilus streckersoni TaxID=2493646 RepID=A0AAE0WBJ3_9BIVA|nr:hypothetical protein CHS0354_042551 [Potamilus streckersoni]